MLSLVLKIFLITNELFLRELPLPVVTDDHPLVPVRNATLVPDVRPRQSVVPCNHHHADLSLLQLSDSPLCLGLQLILKHLETVEHQASLRRLTCDRFVIVPLNTLTADS